MITRWVMLFCVLGVSTITTLAQEVFWQGLSQESILKSAQVGYKIVDVSDQRVISQFQSTKSFTPASNLKLITTGLALDALTPNYCFTTKLMTTGRIQNTVLTGDLYVIGGYDPTTTIDNIIKSWTDSLVKLGVTKIQGDLYVPSVLYSNPYPMDYAWGDMGNYYGAGLYPLNLDDNKISYSLRPGKNIGEPVQLISSSFSDSTFTILNFSKTAAAGTGDKIVIYNSPFSHMIFIEGTIPIGADFTVKGSNPDPAYFFAKEMKACAQSRNIEWVGNVQRFTQETQPATLQLLASWKSNIIREIASVTNSLSNNLYAEALKKAVLMKYNSVDVQAIYNPLLNKMGVDTVGLRVRDGSGMSPLNAISPSQMTSFLLHMRLNNSFRKSIPVAGVQGTVSVILQSYPNRARIKSGTMTGVTCYSGYVTSLAGKEYAFSVMVNHHEGKNKTVQKLLEKYLIELIQYK
ncbi:MAG: D-alanyl-D-alanine carboxypeptidase/D-alanyl-D-alanine-endopeptidase [Cytophagaceae bacterium]